MSFVTDLRFAFRSLLRARGLTITVVLTLALGIGANAAIFSVVRGVLLKPLTNRDEDRLIYIRQSAPGLGTPNMAFSVPEIDDLKARVKSVAAFGDFSDDRVHDGGSRRASRRERGCGERVLLRRDGPAPGPGPPDQRV